MKKTILTLLLATSFLYLHAQNSISGTVTDANDRSLLEGVSVYFPQLEKGTETNAEGYYSIEGLPKGNYKLIVSYLGYQTYSKTIEVSNDKIELNIELTASAIEIEEVIVSTPFHKLQRENVMKVEQASIADLRSSGAITLSDGISSIPGVSTVSTGVGIGKPVIRGLSANRVLVYAQGVRMENQQFGGEHGLGLSDSGVESVEVIKGPASLLYGSDALGGVLYFNPEKFAVSGTTEGDVNLNYFTNTRGIAANAGIRTSTSKMRYLFRGSAVSHIDYMTGDDERLTNSRFNEYDFKAGTAYQANRFKTELRYNFNTANLGIPEEIATQSSERSPELPYQEIATHTVSSKTNLFLEKSSLEFTLGLIANKREEFEDGSEAALSMQLNTLSYNLQYHLPKISKFETIIGIQGMHQSNVNSGEEVLIPDAITDDFGLMATSHWHISEQSDIQLGLRYDHRKIKGEENGVLGEEGFIAELNRKFNSFNTALGYKVNFSKHLIGRVNLASGFRAPNLAELTSNGVHEGANRYEIGDPNLKNERNFQTDVALEYQNEHIEFFANGFYNAVSDFIYLNPEGTLIDTDPVYRYRQQNANLYGGEFGFHFHPHPLDWLHFESSYETVIGKLDTGGYLPLIPANRLYNTLRIEFDKKDVKVDNGYVFLTLQNYFAQNRPSIFETSTDGYTLLNAGLGSTLQLFGQPMDFRISGNNLLNETYISHLSRLKIDGIANIGRNISIGLTIPIS
ncbi:MAG: TonB-dependent receptor [Flavobacteriaceae bacterium]